MKTERQQRHEHAWAIARHQLAASLINARTGRKWSISELARRAGVKAENIKQIEQVRGATPNRNDLELLASALDVGLFIGFVPLSTFGICPVPSFEAERKKP